MIPKKIFDFSSAYSQLILLVFVPITLLAAVGAYLVEREASKAIASEQRTLATAALIRYEPMVKQLLPVILNLEAKATNNSEQALNSPESETHDSPNNEQGEAAAQLDDGSTPIPIESPDVQSLDEVQNRIRFILSSMNNDQYIQRVAVIDSNGKTVASSGDNDPRIWASIESYQDENNQNFISGMPTAMGTAYGHLLGEFDGLKYWLFVDMDNKPLTIAQLKVWLGLGLTGLFTLLLLLLSLNIYAKRWIVPIYDLRLHLQQITPENMYQPVNTKSSGELNQLQQDLLKTFRRLYGDFQELRDHTDQTEEDLREAFDEMEMQNILIREARDQAISSSQAKSAFLANISHELRTPLNSIDGFINLLARHGDLNAEQDLYVQTIRKSSAHLLALVNDVLDFSKIEAGKLVLDKHQFSLYSAIFDVMDMLSPLAAEKGLRMAVLYYNDVPYNIVGDELRVKQVLTNLVGNAIKFTDVGEVVVRIGIDEVEPNDERIINGTDAQANNSQANNGTQTDNNNLNTMIGEMIHIAIQDTGHGISEQAKKQLFKSFSQGDPSITRQYGGTGLGLVISKQLTRLMGGQIGFYDNDQGAHDEQVIGKQVALAESDLSANTASANKAPTRTGATFWFSIPANVEMDAHEDVEFGVNYNELEKAEQITLPTLRHFQTSDGDDKPFEMLVWINHEPSKQVFMAAVRPLNIKVTIARSLAGALERLKESDNRWDWVIIDGGDSEAREDRMALLKQIRLHYQGKLAIYGYQVALDTTLLERYKALGLYQPLDKRQLYRMLDTRTSNVTSMVAPPTWQGVKILAVDDHLPNLLVLDALLGELGITVITANSGYDAVEMIHKQVMQSEVVTALPTNNATQDKQDIDLIFMDVQMPRMSGDEAARKIRQVEDDARVTMGYDGHIPIIALTAHGLSDGKDKLVAAGIDDYVAKPISRPQLLQILQRWLGKGGQPPARMLANDSSQYTTGRDRTSTSEVRRASNLWQHLDDKTKGVHSDGKGLNNSDIDTGESISDVNRTDNISDSLNSDGVSDGNGENDTLNQENKVASLAVVDWKDALIRSANKPDLAKQLLIMMQASIPDEITALEQAWEDRDRHQLAQDAHRILGASRYSGVPQIRQASQNFEDKCLLNVQHTIPSQFEMLQPYYEQLLASLHNLKELDIEENIQQKLKEDADKSLSENDMTWKMI